MKRALFSAMFFVCLLLAFVMGASDDQSPISKTSPPKPGVTKTMQDSTNGDRIFDPDSYSHAMEYTRLHANNGPLNKVNREYRLGAVMKFFGNPYWRLLADGMRKRAKHFNIYINIKAATTELDTRHQIRLMTDMISEGYDALLVSPQTDLNLMDAVEAARARDILVINVSDAKLDNCDHFVGPNQYENGVHAAGYFLRHHPSGGNVAIIRGLSGAYGVRQRSQGFIDTLKNTDFEIIAQPNCDWDLQMALEASSKLLLTYPDLNGFYCNNDIMALGVAQAVKEMNSGQENTVIGTDGIRPAHEAIRRGDLDATIDTFPFITGQIAVDVTLRILENQKVPRVVFSPQRLVTRENLDNPLPESKFFGD